MSDSNGPATSAAASSPAFVRLHERVAVLEAKIDHVGQAVNKLASESDRRWAGLNKLLIVVLTAILTVGTGVTIAVMTHLIKLG